MGSEPMKRPDDVIFFFLDGGGGIFFVVYLGHATVHRVEPFWFPRRNATTEVVAVFV